MERAEERRRHCGAVEGDAICNGIPTLGADTYTNFRETSPHGLSSDSKVLPVATSTREGRPTVHSTQYIRESYSLHYVALLEYSCEQNQKTLLPDCNRFGRLSICY
jgi:hypothetical protein